MMCDVSRADLTFDMDVQRFSFTFVYTSSISLLPLPPPETFVRDGKIILSILNLNGARGDQT